MTKILWVDVLIVAAAVVTAVGVIWRKFLRPLIRALEVASEALPVLLVIASEFQPNHGSSLRDALDRVEKKADTANELAGSAVAAVKSAEAAAQVAASMSEANGTKLESIARDLREHMTDLGRASD